MTKLALLAILFAQVALGEEEVKRHDWLAVGQSHDSVSSRAEKPTEVAENKPITTYEYKAGFHLTIGVGSGWHGLNVLEINDDKTAQLFTHEPSLAKASISLTDEDITSLVKLLNDEKVGSLSKVYSAGIQDGTQWVISLQEDGQAKSIYLDNSFPKQAQRLVEWANTLLAKRIEKTAPLTPEEWGKANHAAWAQLKK